MIKELLDVVVGDGINVREGRVWVGKRELKGLVGEMFQLCVNIFILEKGPYVSSGTVNVNDCRPNIVGPADGM